MKMHNRFQHARANIHTHTHTNTHRHDPNAATNGRVTDAQVVVAVTGARNEMDEKKVVDDCALQFGRWCHCRGWDCCDRLKVVRVCQWMTHRSVDQLNSENPCADRAKDCDECCLGNHWKRQLRLRLRLQLQLRLHLNAPGSEMT